MSNAPRTRSARCRRRPRAQPAQVQKMSPDCGTWILIALIGLSFAPAGMDGPGQCVEKQTDDGQTIVAQPNHTLQPTTPRQHNSAQHSVSQSDRGDSTFLLTYKGKT
ncbi:MAG: hypothetical protein RL215_2367 [Planctomycetota bacterium]